MVKRKAPKKKSKVDVLKIAEKKAQEFNKKAHWKAYKELQMRADRAWNKFRTDVRKNAKRDVLIKDHNHLLLLLAECNYMARECARFAAKSKKKR